jgi:hypothetical protein
MKFFGWLMILVGATAAIAGLVMSGMAPGGDAAAMERLISKLTLVLFGCGLGVAGTVLVVGAELRLWLSAIYDEIGGGEAAAPVREEKPRAETSRASKSRAHGGMQRAEPVII